MRKKLKMRAGGAVKKYAEGGRVAGGQRPTEDRAAMAAEAAAGFDEEERRVMERRNAPRRSLITNAPVGDNNADAARGVRRSGLANMPPAPTGTDDVDGTGTGASARRTRLAMPTPPRPPARGTARARPRNREMSADDLNDMSLALIRRGNMGPNRDGAESNISRTMGYKKGGSVNTKRK
jgi:hypothetical protein